MVWKLLSVFAPHSIIHLSLQVIMQRQNVKIMHKSKHFEVQRSTTMQDKCLILLSFQWFPWRNLQSFKFSKSHSHPISSCWSWFHSFKVKSHGIEINGKGQARTSSAELKTPRKTLSWFKSCQSQFSPFSTNYFSSCGNNHRCTELNAENGTWSWFDLSFSDWLFNYFLNGLWFLSVRKLLLFFLASANGILKSVWRHWKHLPVSKWWHLYSQTKFADRAARPQTFFFFGEILLSRVFPRGDNCFWKTDLVSKIQTKVDELNGFWHSLLGGFAMHFL